MLIQQYSLQGKRPSNEDKHTIIQNLTNENKDISPINFIGLYDGHGGVGVSKFMSENLHKCYVTPCFNDIYQSGGRYHNHTHKTFDYLQNKLNKEHPSIAKKSGSTVLAVTQYNYNGNSFDMSIANLGDCRAVLCNKYNIPIQLTKDHKPNSFEERQRIEQMGGNIKFDGYDWRVGDLSLSRAMGDIDNKPYVSHLPEVYKYNVTNQDKFIIYACDGLWDVLDNQEVTSFVHEYLNKGVDPKTTNYSKLLADFALRSGSTDNISVITQFLHI
jgi:serine/threonine protein phosphatase PrpC